MGLICWWRFFDATEWRFELESERVAIRVAKGLRALLSWRLAVEGLPCEFSAVA